MPGPTGRGKDELTWNRVKGHGRSQPLSIGIIGALIGSVSLTIAVISFLVGHSVLGVIFFLPVTPAMIFSIVGFQFYLKKEYYVNYSYIFLNTMDIGSRWMEAFIDHFMEGKGVDAGKRADKQRVQVKWVFKGDHQGEAFLIMNGEKVLMVGIKDRFGDLSELIDSFVMELNVEFDIYPGEKNVQGWLD